MMNAKDVPLLSKRDVTPPNEPWELPKYLTISKGQEFSGLTLMQWPRLQRFVDQNRERFEYYANRDAAIYVGADAVIPE